MKSETRGYYIGWDVGGWNCDHNGKSRDAVVILDDALALVGKPWRGNLRQSINEALSSRAWVEGLFQLCQAPPLAKGVPVFLAIDTPLGFSEPFLQLALDLKLSELVEERSENNPYLFRRTEKFLFENKLSPLSAVKDMIGSQATKGMHVLSKFAPYRGGTGVWTNREFLTVIEAYPTAAKKSGLLPKLYEGSEFFDHVDKKDALTCALVSWLFATNVNELAQPGPDVPEREGWIWVPRDILQNAESKRK